MITLKEYGKLVQGNGQGDLSLGYVSSHEDWLFLQQLAHSGDKAHQYIRVSHYHNKPALQVTKFVGVITTPSGLQIEILPKITTAENDAENARSLLWKMLTNTPDIALLQATDANLRLADKPLIEAMISRFLTLLADMIRRGIRKDYQLVEAEELFLKGSLQLAKQLRQPMNRQHLFQIEYDVFSENRAENRLIHSALLQVAKWSTDADNQKLGRKLRFSFDEVPSSTHIQRDLQQWQTSRDMIYYQPLLPFLTLILNQQCPLSLQDAHAGISFLIPMNKLFESYVYHTLSKNSHEKLIRQSQAGYLTTSPQAFMLKPDMLKKNQLGEIIEVLDTKWKLIDDNALYANGKPDEKWGISQADMYQIYAYGKKLLPNGRGIVTLIYPKWSGFSQGNLLNFDDDLSLQVLPFCLENDRLCHIEC